MAYINGKKVISIVRTNYLSETERDLIARYHLGEYDTLEDNTITRQTGYVDLGSLEWTLDTSIASYNYFTASPTWLNIQIPSSGAVVADIVTSKYTTRSWESMIGNLSDNSICLNDGAYNLIRIRDTSYNDANVFKASLNGVILQYKLATPYTEQVIDGQPLITLDQKGSEWLRNEWEKELNLFNINEFEQGGTTGVVSGNSVTVTGEWYITYKLKVKPNTKYYVSYNASGSFQRIGIWDTTNTTNIKNFDNQVGGYFNSGSYTEVNVLLFAGAGTSGTTTYSNIMLNEGDHAYPYQPYNGAIIHDKDITPVLLWENGSPNSDFAAQTITTSDMSKYKYIVVEFKIYKTFVGSQFVKVRYAIGDSGSMSYIASTSIGRSIYIASTTTITFPSAYENGVANNEFIIPIRVYGTNVL